VKELLCDRCGKKINLADERLIDHLKVTYPGVDICGDCDIAVVLARECTARGVFLNVPFGTTVRRMLERCE
jgi:hypothetical protein